MVWRCFVSNFISMLSSSSSFSGETMPSAVAAEIISSELFRWSLMDILSDISMSTGNLLACTCDSVTTAVGSSRQVITRVRAPIRAVARLILTGSGMPPDRRYR